jgi:hypothetical protein
MLGENCRTGCRTRHHNSYGECLRDANPRVTFAATPNNSWDRDIEKYRAVRQEGIQPDTTNPRDVEVAKAFSDKTGVAYDAGNKGETLLKAGVLDA